VGCAVILLCIPKYRVAALWLVLFLLVLFTSGLVINLLRGSPFSCGCFRPSPSARPVDWLSVARNGALMGLIGLALNAFKRSR